MRGAMGGTISGIRNRIRKLHLSVEDEALVLSAVGNKTFLIPEVSKQTVRRIRELAKENVPIIVRYTKRAGWTVYSLDSWQNKIKNLNVNKANHVEDVNANGNEQNVTQA